jgi:hypothetical protein
VRMLLSSVNQVAHCNGHILPRSRSFPAILFLVQWMWT